MQNSQYRTEISKTRPGLVIMQGAEHLIDTFYIVLEAQ